MSKMLSSVLEINEEVVGAVKSMRLGFRRCCVQIQNKERGGSLTTNCNKTNFVNSIFFNETFFWPTFSQHHLPKYVGNDATSSFKSLQFQSIGGKMRQFLRGGSIMIDHQGDQGVADIFVNKSHHWKKMLPFYTEILKMSFANCLRLSSASGLKFSFLAIWNTVNGRPWSSKNCLVRATKELLPVSLDIWN